MPDNNYLESVVVGLANVTSARSGVAREYRGDERDDETIKRLQELMDAKKQGTLPTYLFKPQRDWYAHGHGIFSRLFQSSSKTSSAPDTCRGTGTAPKHPPARAQAERGEDRGIEDHVREGGAQGPACAQGGGQAAQRRVSRAPRGDARGGSRGQSAD